LPGEKLLPGYHLVSDYKERCQKLEAEVTKRLRQTPSSQRLQGMGQAVSVLRGDLTVEEAIDPRRAKFTENCLFAPGYKERWQKLELEVTKRLRQTPDDQRLQGMELVIGVLRGKRTVEQAFTNLDKTFGR